MANTFNNAQAQLSSTSVTDVYQAPATAGNTAIVLSVLCANVNGTAAADISIIKTNSSNTIQSYLAFTIPVPADTSLEVVANKIILKAGEKLRAQASAANYINVTISALEIT
jgi:3D (Asp-Asp-Asp) domain-containing protein